MVFLWKTEVSLHDSEFLNFFGQISQPPRTRPGQGAISRQAGQEILTAEREKERRKTIR